MKRMNKFTMLLFTGIFLLTSGSVYSQMGQGRRGMAMQNTPRMYQRCEAMIPNLTEEQENKIEQLRTSHMKEMMNQRNQLNEKRARLRTLQTQENPNMNEVYNVIEEMGAIRTGMQKKRAEHHQEIRSLLNDEQKVMFDRNLVRRGKGMRGKGMMGGQRGFPGCRRM